MNKVYFIGAGPGDPELITLKGKRLIDEADTIIYAGSLVNPELFKDNKAKIYNSAYLTLGQVLDIITKDYLDGKRVVRVHTGDPSLYGAIREQIDRLEAQNIPTEVVPGVSSFSAAAATLKREYTLPEVSQTLILTRMPGRTPVPEKESLKSLAAHQSSMALFLSASLVDEVERILLEEYSPDTPAAIVVRASWPDERVFNIKLGELSKTVKENNIFKTALILIGNFLGEDYELSKLYDAGFSHEFRKKEKIKK